MTIAQKKKSYILEKLKYKVIVSTETRGDEFSIQFDTPLNKEKFIDFCQKIINIEKKYKKVFPIIEGEDWLVNGIPTGLKYNSRFGIIFIFKFKDKSQLRIKSYNTKNEVVIYTL